MGWGLCFSKTVNCCLSQQKPMSRDGNYIFKAESERTTYSLRRFRSHCLWMPFTGSQNKAGIIPRLGLSLWMGGSALSPRFIPWVLLSWLLHFFSLLFGWAFVGDVACTNASESLLPTMSPFGLHACLRTKHVLGYLLYVCRYLSTPRSRDVSL